MLAELIDIIYIVYLDDILIFSEDPIEYIRYIYKVLERLRKADLYINLRKCRFKVDRVNFLRFVVSPGGIEMELE